MLSANRVTHSARLRGRLEDLRQGGDIFERLVVSEMDYLTQALETVDRPALQKAVNCYVHVSVSLSLVPVHQFPWLNLLKFG